MESSHVLIWRGNREIDTCTHCCWDGEIEQMLWKVHQFLKMVNINLPSNLEISTPSYILMRNKQWCLPNSCKKKNVTFFMIAPKWKRPKCFSSEGWIKKMWYIHYSEISFGIKKGMKNWYMLQRGWMLTSSKWKTDANATYSIILFIWIVPYSQICRYKK